MKGMNDYTVVFDHPDHQTPERLHLTMMNIRHVHLMFFGKLANEWDDGWEAMRFDDQADLSLAHGTILIKDKPPLHYTILPGHQEPGAERTNPA
jgi:hypothetical protein